MILSSKLFSREIRQEVHVMIFVKLGVKFRSYFDQNWPIFLGQNKINHPIEPISAYIFSLWKVKSEAHTLPFSPNIDGRSTMKVD